MTVVQGVFTDISLHPDLPAILCLHGGGSSASIFNIQTIRIQRMLSGKFHFIFLEGPFETEAGPGVLPVFEGYGSSYHSWVAPNDTGLSEQTRSAIEEAISNDKLHFVGVMGFSQGARLAAGLLLEQQLQVEETSQRKKGFKFGIFCMGVSPPMVSSNRSMEEKTSLIKTPTAHVLGLEDPWRDESRKLFKCCDEHYSTMVELPLGHRLPMVMEETQLIVGEIIRLHSLTSAFANAL